MQTVYVLMQNDDVYAVFKNKTVATRSKNFLEEMEIDLRDHAKKQGNLRRNIYFRIEEAKYDVSKEE